MVNWNDKGLRSCIEYHVVKFTNKKPSFEGYKLIRVFTVLCYTVVFSETQHHGISFQGLVSQCQFNRRSVVYCVARLSAYCANGCSA